MRIFSYGRFVVGIERHRMLPSVPTSLWVAPIPCARGESAGAATREHYQVSVSLVRSPEAK